MLSAIVLLLFLTVTVFDCVTLLKHADKKVRLIYSLIMLVSFGVLLLYSLDVRVPSTNDAITSALEAILKLKG